MERGGVLSKISNSETRYSEVKVGCTCTEERLVERGDTNRARGNEGGAVRQAMRERNSRLRTRLKMCEDAEPRAGSSGAYDEVGQAGRLMLA
eukprot:556917-Pleurochrysis_carterae.AAC.2